MIFLSHDDRLASSQTQITITPPTPVSDVTAIARLQPVFISDKPLNAVGLVANVQPDWRSEETGRTMTLIHWSALTLKAALACLWSSGDHAMQSWTGCPGCCHTPRAIFFHIYKKSQAKCCAWFLILWSIGVSSSINPAAAVNAS